MHLSMKMKKWWEWWYDEHDENKENDKQWHGRRWIKWWKGRIHDEIVEYEENDEHDQC